MDSELLLILIISCVAVLLAALMLYAMRGGKKKKKEEPLEVPEVPEVREGWPPKAERSVTSADAKKAQDELRILDLEREILSHAIRRLYEAQAEGKISEEERDRLAQGYKGRMLEIKEMISKGESVVALHELETMQEDLIKLFNERFDEINEKIGNLRSSLEFEPVKEVPIPSPAPPYAPSEKAERKARKPSAPKKTEAEKRIEEIRAEVEKVLERLGQIEVEA
ncbi:MAG: hypothetical protein OEX06_02960 [Candidatus Bathyarchaeota archaeon]|nr:hypothetical protein [Candidatus Bathyarchaeota archaeon]MDH5702250.1 hypothetical protein [Candidatus Bathyarchaeota archaeon]